MPFNFNPFPKLKTNRLLLNPITSDDCDVLFELRTNRELTKYIKRVLPKSLEEIEKFVLKINKQVEKSINWRISLKENDKMIGSICLWNFSNDYKTGEVGYDLLSKSHGKGVMNEALQKVINYGFLTLDLNKIVAYTHFENKPSISLLKKNNFVLDAAKRDEENLNNRIYSLTR